MPQGSSLAESYQHLKKRRKKGLPASHCLGWTRLKSKLQVRGISLLDFIRVIFMRAFYIRRIFQGQVQIA